jgi:Ca2+-binding RTX toxin-like protein
MLMGPGNDTAGGGIGNDSIQANQGADSIDGGLGDDCLRGGKDNDIVEGGEGNDILYGDRGEDQVFGGADSDTILGGQDNDLLDGGDGNDSLRGGKGNDTVLGGAGDDVLGGDKGNDVLTGGEGADIFFFLYSPSGQYGTDTLTDFNSAEGDVIGLRGTDFNLETGVLAEGEFAVVEDFLPNQSNGLEASIVYDPNSGFIYFNGSPGAGDESAIARVDPGTDLSAGDFEIF